MDREQQLKQLQMYKEKMHKRKMLQEQLKKNQSEKEKIEKKRDEEIEAKADDIYIEDSASATYFDEIKERKKRIRKAVIYSVIKSIKTLCILFILILLVATVLVSIFTFDSFDLLKLGVVVGVVFFFLVAFLPPETKDADKAGKGYTGVSSYVYFAINIGLALINTFLFPILNKKTCFGLIGVSILACILWLFIIPLGRKWRRITEDESYEIMTNEEKTTLENLEKQDAINKKKNDEQREQIEREVYTDYEQKIHHNMEEHLSLLLQIKIVEEELGEMKIISKEDENLVDEIIRVMTRNKTYSMNDAISYVDKQMEISKKKAKRKKRLNSEIYGGKHWTLSDLSLTEANIEELELDAEDLFHSFQSARPSEFKAKIYDSWFGEAVTVAMLLEKPNFPAGADFRKEIVAKLKNSGSWKLKILGMTLELTIANVIYSSELSPELTLYSTYADEETGRSDEEKEYFSTLNLGAMIACSAFKRMASEQLGMGNSYSSSYDNYGYSSGYNTSNYQSVSSYSSSESYDPNGPKYNYAASSSGSYNISHADKKVCIVGSAWDADQKVFFTNVGDADVKYYIVDSAWDADLKVFPVGSAWDADIKAYRIN